MTCGLSLAAQGAWVMAMLFYLLAVIGFMGANVFYDALLMQVIKKSGQESDRVSALGFALGYLGGGLLFAVCVLMTQQPQWFMLENAAAAVKVSFFLVALWWAVFSIPILVFVDEEIKPTAVLKLGQALERVVKTIRELRVLKAAALFLFAYWLYIDGVGTVVRMAIDYGISIGFDSNHLIIAL